MGRWVGSEDGGGRRHSIKGAREGLVSDTGESHLSRT